MLALVLLALLPAVARGANVPVTTTADRDNGTCAAGDCSLREAVKYALSGSTVEVPAGTYDLTLGALRIDRPGTRLEIEGPVVDGVPGGEHPTAIVRQTEPAMRVFELVAGDQEIILRHLRITGGRATDASPAWGVQETEAHGGGIVNVGALLLEQVEVDGNSATGSLERAAAGGGISARGSLILRDSRVHDNEVSGVGQDGPRGGGIHISGGSGSLQRSAIDHNEVNGSYGEGGGLSVSFAGMRLEGTRVSDNTITAPAGWADGGGIHLRSGGMLIRRSAITNNTADASASDWRSVGGGIYAAPYILTIESTTIHGNTAAGGEAADNTTNVSKGGGLALTGDVPVHAVNVTVTGNTVTGNDLASGGNVVSGIFNLSENALFLRSSIIAGGSAPAPGTDTCTGIIVSEGYNLVDEANACGLSEATRDRTGVDPQLGPLQDNGGPTPTRVPGAGSPALNLGPGGGCLDIEDRPLRDDQRYTQRGAVCDAGAVDDGATGASTAPAGTPDVAVSTTADRPDAGGCAPGNCTLREALAHAPAGSTVTLAEGRYQLGEGELAAQRAAALSIRGAGAGSTVIEQAPGEAARVLLVGKQASITLAGVTVRGGANEQGGGIRNEGTLHLRDAVVKENTARIGGGIANSGQLYVTNSVIEANEAVGTEQEVQALGGGIYTGAAASIQRSLVARNVARGHGAGPASGGGIAAFLAGGLLLEGTGVEDNKVIGGPGGGAAAGGGISAEGALAGLIPGPPVLSRGSLLAGNEAEATGGGRAIGGGLAATSPSALTLDRTTITGNGVEGDAAEGGGLLIDSGVPVAALGSVIADNSAAGSGASGAQAGFDAVNDAPTLLLGHSVVAGEGTDPCTAGTVISIGSSLVDAGEGECGVGSGEGDLTGTEPLLGPLADHGGPVRTREPLPGSPLIGNGGECIDSLGNPMTLDGRGFPAGSECDIGAYDTSTESSPGVDSGPATGDRPDGPVDPEPTPTPTPTPEPTPIATAEPTPGPGPGPTPGPGPGPGPIATPTPTPPPGGGPTPTAKPKAADVIRLPGARRCVSRRKGLRVRLRAPSGDRVVRSTVRAGRKKARRLTGRRARGPLALKGKALPRRGKVKVKVQVRLSSGTNLSRSRTYRICR